MKDPESDTYQEWNLASKRSASPDLATRLMDDMDPEVLEFLKSTVNSFIKWDLVIFFSENPNTTDTAVNLARYIGRDVSVIEEELDELASAGALTREPAGKLTVYSLTADPAMRERVRHFVAVVSNVQYRGKVFYHLIRGMR